MLYERNFTTVDIASDIQMDALAPSASGGSEVMVM
jgi:hypothetical protein